MVPLTPKDLLALYRKNRSIPVLGMTKELGVIGELLYTYVVRALAENRLNNIQVVGENMVYHLKNLHPQL
ncbi:hypothetical protein AAFM79_01050 [Trichormus azollae HNT15244]